MKGFPARERRGPAPRRVGYNLDNPEDVESLREELLALQGSHAVDHPSRILFVRGIPPETDRAEIRALFAQFGEVKKIYDETLENDFIYVFYYNIRHARCAFEEAKRRPLFDRFLHVRYAIARDSPDDIEQNQGTMVVFNLDVATTNETLREIFGRYGEVKEVRETMNKKFHRFVEFQDLRDAQHARDALNNTVLFGRRIKVEPSRPGGARQERLSSVTQSIGLPAGMPALPPPEDVVQMLNEFLAKRGKGAANRVCCGKLPKFTSPGQELCPSYVAEVEGTPHIRRSPSPSQTQFPDNDANKAVVVISNIPMTVPVVTVFDKIQRGMTCFYDQLLLLHNRTTQTYQLVVEVTNPISLNALTTVFNGLVLDSDQDEKCVAYVSSVSPGEFTANLYKLIQ